MSNDAPSRRQSDSLGQGQHIAAVLQTTGWTHAKVPVSAGSPAWSCELFTENATRFDDA
jgi:hypothetical protein